MIWSFIALAGLFLMVALVGVDALKDKSPRQWRGRPRLEWWQSAAARRRAWRASAHHMDAKFTVRRRNRG